MPTNWVSSSPISWWERLSAFQAPVAESYSRSQDWAFSVVRPVPRFLGRNCSGCRVTSSLRPPTVRSRTTSVRVSGSAWSLRSLLGPDAWRAPGTPL